jgi:excisionase family DNA binding protein
MGKGDIQQRLITIKQGAVYLGRGVYGVRELIWSGRLPYVQMGKGGKIWLDIRDLELWIQNNKWQEVR